QTVRSDLGLAYAVFGVYTADYETPGVFYAGTFTKSESTVEAARAMLDVIEGMQARPPTDEELSLAKEAYLNAFVFNFDTRGEVLNRQMTSAYYGYPEDFIQRAKDGAEAVTAADVQRVARQYPHPHQAKVLVLGNSEHFGGPVTPLGAIEVLVRRKSEEVGQPVTALGDVDVRDATTPTAPAGEAGAAPAGGDAGDALLGRALAALGDADAFAAIEAVRYEAETEAELSGQLV